MAAEYRYECCETGFFIRVVVVTLLVLFAGLMSGLTLGLMSMSLVDLEVLANSGTPSDRKHASKILPVVRRQHLLLCTLLFCNAAAMEALPIFLDSLVPAWGAIVISVTLILSFGEIIPQAVCARYGLAIGAKVAPFVQILVWICFPIAFPVSKLLDLLLGKGNEALFRRAELKTLVDLHGNEAGKGGELTRDETTIITGALELSEKTARDAMTPASETFAIDVSFKLDRNLMRLVLEKGHSRVPVKNLLTIHPEDEVPVKNVSIRRIPRVSETMPLYDILNEFQKGHSHMAVVVRHQNDREQPHVPIEHSTDERQVRVDIDGFGHLKEKCLKTKRSLKKRNRLSHDANLHRGASTSKNWSRDFHSEVLHIPDDPQRMLNGEWEAVGIITLEDVIEELLQIVHPAVSVLFLNQSVPVKDLIIGNNAKEAANQ
ncbi:hypothetical protein CUMW_124430 [Citrus unshiu]|nr:hypothetical protein CUMW_124430 [Citrus unshiu]